jgi:hypothetical protein
VGSVESSATVPDSALVACVLNTVRALKFPEPTNGATATVTYPFVFAPGDDDQRPAAHPKSRAPAGPSTRPSPPVPPGKKP